ncbi:AAA family ATPase [Streptomyces sp. NA02950]|uniref:ATP-binding protein n=1 Tax=Streptomyces sp. NA02950 TaxID=2742137 RepID=UPI0015909A37|nr:LuxR C-terminal-related transcriptional regulator [Streptomyces sp. NA02950]QKV90759.1 AAA family ATPase [Streptomyces sp. NA02950]
MPSPVISAREAEVLALLGEFLSNAEIAARLFISVRTVESHVSSLLRKLQMPDRRALSRHAAEAARAGQSRPAPALPAPLTAFIGRGREREQLAGEVLAHRLVTVVGPGGVGKTRLALAVAADVAEGFADGVWFVNLVPITEPSRVGATVAAAVGVGERPGRGIDDAVPAALADRRALLVLDNCEQVRDGVAPFLERLLAACPRLRVLVTSRARLMVPFERVFPVPPLSRTGGEESEAVALFMDRAAAVGQPPGPAVGTGVVAICERLGGMALAIELAAARWSTLGLDGLAAGLGDQLRILTGGPRADERHRSVRAVLDWSHDLLEPRDQALLRRVSVFVAPFTAEAAAGVAGFAPLDPTTVVDGLGRLAEQSLLAVTPSAAGTRYQALETIRQYGTERLSDADELIDVRSRHLDWCVSGATALEGTSGADWRARFDAVADDLRAALTWAADQPERRADAHGLAVSLAELAFSRNLLGESQQRYEQAAGLAAAAGGAALRQAASVAGCRRLGDDMFRLHRAAGEAARRAGDDIRAGRDLAEAATAAYRFSTSFTRIPTVDEVKAMLVEARELAGDSPDAEAAVALAQAAVVADAFGALQGDAENTAHETAELARQAVALARRTGDPVAMSAAIDALSGAQSWTGDAFAVAAAARRRIDILASVPPTPASTHELMDALAMAAGTALGVGELPEARRWGGQLADHPLMAEAGHHATSWILVADAFAGRAEEVLTRSVRFLEAWGQSGRPRSLSLGAAAASVAMVQGLRGDQDARAAWLAIVDEADTAAEHRHGYGAVFDAILLLHRGEVNAALERVAPEPEQVWKWVCWVWLHWYVALRAEAAVLAGHPDARGRIDAARTVVPGNPVATALVDRAEALLDGDLPRLLAAAAAFDAADCPYQSARTLLLAGGEHATAGTAALAGLGLAPGPSGSRRQPSVP